MCSSDLVHIAVGFHMRLKMYLTVEQLPAMHMVNIQNAWYLLQALSDLFQVDMRWRALHQDIGALLQDLPCLSNNYEADKQGEQRVDP